MRSFLLIVIILVIVLGGTSISDYGPTNLCGRALNHYIVNLCSYGTNYGYFAKREIITEADYRELIASCCIGVCRDEDLVNLC